MLQRIQYQPGNGSNYDLMYGKVEGNGYLLVWLKRGGSGGVAFRFDDAHTCNPDDYLLNAEFLHRP